MDREWPGMNSKIFNYKLSWPIGKMCSCGQVDKRVDNRSRGRSSSSDEYKGLILEYSVQCVVEGLGMRVCKEGATWKIRWVGR